jgi:hypothetical protein
LVHKQGAGHAEQVFSYSWRLSGYFIDYVKTTPSLRLEGQSTGGKSTAIDLISFPLYGQDVKKISTTAANYTDGAKNPVVVLDNLETSNMTEGVKDFIITAVTGITKEKRRGGTDNDNISEKVKCLICSTGIENFSVPEVINRLYIVDIDHLTYGSNYSDSVFVDILKKRDYIMSAELVMVSRILKKMQDGTWRAYEAKTQSQYKGHSKERANSFLAIMTLVAEELLSAWDSKENVWDLLDKWITSQNETADKTSIDSNPILQCLNILKHEVFKYEAQSGSTLSAPWQFDVRLVTSSSINGTLTVMGHAKDLNTTFSKLCQLRAVPYPFKNARQLSSRIKSENGTLEKAGWYIVDQGEDRDGKLYSIELSVVA